MKIVSRIRKFENLGLAAALAIGLTACSGSDDNSIDVPTTTTQDTPKTYTMTIEASMGDDATRALSTDGTGALNATWAEGDAVKVYNPVAGASYSDPDTYVEVGTLKATAISTDGLTATLTGTVTLDSKTWLYLFYVGQYNDGTATGSVASVTYDYSSQAGTLDDVAARFDRAMATLAASKYDLTDGKIVTTSTLSFTNQQAIVKFNLKNASGNAVNVSQLVVEATGVYDFYMSGNGTNDVPGRASTITATPVSASTSTFTIAIPPLSSAATTFSIRLTANGTDGYTYYYEKADVTTFAKGKYYEISVKMKRYKDLSKLTETYTAQDGDELRGSMPNGKRLNIASGASVTLNGVSIVQSSLPGITCQGDATITLVGENSVTTSSDTYAGIQAGGSGTTLTIGGDGILTVTSDRNGAGIGSSYSSNCGTITISGGTVNATSGSKGTGIGSGNNSTCGAINICGGSVTATSGSYGAGIGSSYSSTCGTITISGGMVNATGGSDSAGIGTGYNGTCGAINISGGTVNAIGGSLGAGIGSGNKGTCGAINISGGSVTATGSSTAAGIGTGANSTCSAITISNGTVSATAGKNTCAGIGSCSGSKFESITITDGISSVTATGVSSNISYPIGKGNSDSGSGSVTVDGVSNWMGSETTNLSFSAGGVIIGGEQYMRWVLAHR